MSEAQPEIVSSETPTPSSRRSVWTVAGIVFLVALGLRLLGLGWGLPNSERLFSLHPDEPINLLYAQRGIEPARLSFTPDFYNYGTLYLTATRVASDVATTYGGKNARAELVGPRVLSTLAGSLCAMLVALYFARRERLAAAWVAGLATATANGFAIHSRFATVDVLATAFLTGGLLVAMGAPEAVRPRRAIVGAAILIGAAAACKYNMALGLLGVLVAAGGLPRERRLPTMILSVVVFLGTFLIGVPGALLQTESFLRDVRYELVHTATGHGLVFEGTAPGFFYHLANLVLAAGVLTLLLGSFGLGSAARRRERWAIIALVFAIPYFLLIGRAEVKFFRYVLPLVPLLAMGVGSLIQRLFDEKRRHLAGAAAILTVAGLGPGGLAAALGSSAEMATTDPRDAAGAYLREKAASSSVGIATDPWFWTPTIYPEVPAPRSVGAARYLGWMVSQTNPRVLRFLPENARERIDFDPRLLTDLRPEYLAMTSLEINAPERFQKQDVSKNPEAQTVKERYREFSAIRDRDYEIVQTFGPGRTQVVEDLEYVAPTVYVWKRKNP